jgi:hypothetical protein
MTKNEAENTKKKSTNKGQIFPVNIIKEPAII